MSTGQDDAIGSIAITRDGDTIVPLMKDTRWRRSQVLPTIGTIPIGMHEYCGGFVTRRQTSKTHCVLVCLACALRVIALLSIVTYGDLEDGVCCDGSVGPPKG